MGLNVSTWLPRNIKMKRSQIISLVAVLAVLPSCSRDVYSPHSAKEPISFGVPQSKALLDNSSLLTDGNILRINDVLTDYTDPKGAYISKTVYFEDLFQYSAGDWLRNSDRGHYYWTQGGRHKFFGWTRQILGSDVTGLLSDYSLGTSENPARLWIGPTVLNTASPQDDFLYTDVYFRDLNTNPNDYSQVPLTFYHLFSALGINIENNTSTPLTINSLSITGLRNKSTENILFNDSGVTISYNPLESDGDFIAHNVTGNIPARSASESVHHLDAMSLELDSQSSSTRFIWPQTLSLSTPMQITLGYTSGTSAPSTKSYTLSSGVFKSGGRHRLNLRFNGENAAITAALVPLPWDYESGTLDLEVRGVGLSFDASRYNVSASNVLTVRTSDSEIRGNFTPTAPQLGTWFVGIEGESEYFSISPTTGIIDGESVELVLTPKTVDAEGHPLDRHSEHSITLHFGILSGSMQADATEIFNPRNYTILLPAIN